jgi:hypothetical protein
MPFAEFFFRYEMFLMNVLEKIKTYFMFYNILLFHGINIFAEALQRYVICVLPLLFSSATANEIAVRLILATGFRNKYIYE